MIRNPDCGTDTDNIVFVKSLRPHCERNPLQRSRDTLATVQATGGVRARANTKHDRTGWLFFFFHHFTNSCSKSEEITWASGLTRVKVHQLLELMKCSQCWKDTPNTAEGSTCSAPPCQFACIHKYWWTAKKKNYKNGDGTKKCSKQGVSASGFCDIIVKVSFVCAE